MPTFSRTCARPSRSFLALLLLATTPVAPAQTPSSPYAQGREALAAHHPEQAAQLFAQAAATPNPPPDTLFLEARALLDADHIADAARTVRQFLAANPASAPAQYLLAYVLFRQNKPQESLAQYTLAAKIVRPTPTDLQTVALDYVLLKDFDDADKWMSLAVQSSGNDPESWYGLGRIHYSEQRFQDAVDCFRRSLELAPRSVKAENNLGLSLEGLNRTEEAIVAYRNAVTWQQEQAKTGSRPSEQPLLNLGIALIRQDKLDQALPLLQEAESIAPADPRIHEQLGHLYLNSSHLAEAQKEFEDAIGLSPNNSAFHFLLGQVYRRRGLASQAAAEFSRSAALASTHSN